MKLDVRLPIGFMFATFGVILAGYGLTSGSAIYQRSLGINVNLWWGLVLIGFGAVMLFLAARSGRPTPEQPSTDSTDTKPDRP
jgi:hypothetical protein